MATEISNQHFAPALSVHQSLFPQENQQRLSSENLCAHRQEKLPEEEKKNLQLIVKELNDVAKTIDSKRLQFIIDQETKDIIVKVIDVNTNEVIKELPEEELQKLHKSIREAVGLLIDELI